MSVNFGHVFVVSARCICVSQYKCAIRCLYSVKFLDGSGRKMYAEYSYCGYTGECGVSTRVWPWRDPFRNVPQEGNPAEPLGVKGMKEPSCLGNVLLGGCGDHEEVQGTFLLWVKPSLDMLFPGSR